jgi:hypothetical protein
MGHGRPRTGGPVRQHGQYTMTSDERTDLSEEVSAGDQVDVAVRIAVATRHWQSAGYMAARAEVERLGHTSADSRAIHGAYVTGAVGKVLFNPGIAQQAALVPDRPPGNRLRGIELPDRECHLVWGQGPSGEVDLPPRDRHQLRGLHATMHDGRPRSERLEVQRCHRLWAGVQPPRARAPRIGASRGGELTGFRCRADVLSPAALGLLAELCARRGGPAGAPGCGPNR